MKGSIAESWIKLIQKFQALNHRERWMIAGAVLCVFYALFSFIVSPMLDRQRLLNSEIVSKNAQMEALSLALGSEIQQRAFDPDLPQKQKIVSLQKNLTALETKINDLKNTLISPEKMPDLLSDLLKNNANLTLISLKTLPTKGLLENDTPPAIDQQNAVPIFKHGVEMTVEGRYLDLMHYVAMLEQMPWHVLWERANLLVDDKNSLAMPLSQLTLTVYTLSLDKTWLSI